MKIKFASKEDVLKAYKASEKKYYEVYKRLAEYDKENKNSI